MLDISIFIQKMVSQSSIIPMNTLIQINFSKPNHQTNTLLCKELFSFELCSGTRTLSSVAITFLLYYPYRLPELAVRLIDSFVCTAWC
ncbi:hypothetical protein BRADI_2g35482v3 [Brachypodium distachyon]|uniref:Uncharacterized protein n=1 Tax=Brachypodium distachyon TaxID=15368 RepID=A0A0Q3R1W3_BRADI|nr:hypothetical protein BRADI_2g35482v3 [Brachypodium distachyon]